jgi:hypothetical protein
MSGFPWAAAASSRRPSIAAAIDLAQDLPIDLGQHFVVDSTGLEAATTDQRASG